MQSARSNCNALQFLCLHIQHMAALPHAPTSPKTRTCCCTQPLISRCQGRLWLSTVTGWVLDFPASAVVACQCRKLLWAMACFPIARTGHQHGASDFVNDVRLLQNTLPGIDAECLVPPRGSLSNHTLGVRWLPIPSRAALFEWFKGIFLLESHCSKVQAVCASLPRPFCFMVVPFPSCDNNPAVKYSCRYMDKRVLESLTVSHLWEKMHFLNCYCY